MLCLTSKAATNESNFGSPSWFLPKLIHTLCNLFVSWPTPWFVLYTYFLAWVHIIDCGLHFASRSTVNIYFCLQVKTFIVLYLHELLVGFTWQSLQLPTSSAANVLRKSLSSSWESSCESSWESHCILSCAYWKFFAHSKAVRSYDILSWNTLLYTI